MHGVRDANGRSYGDSAGLSSGRRQAGSGSVRRRAADLGRRNIAAGSDRATAPDRRSAGPLPPGAAGTRAGKPVQVAFDGGRLTSDAGILLPAAIEQRLGIADRLANCIEDPRAPERVRHTLAGMIRYRALLIAAGYPDGNDCDALRSDPAFKMSVGRLPESGADLCSQPTISRLENLPGPTALKRMMAAMVEVFCDSFEQVPRHPARHRRHRGPGSRRPATRTVQRLLRQPLL